MPAFIRKQLLLEGQVIAMDSYSRGRCPGSVHLPLDLSASPKHLPDISPASHATERRPFMCSRDQASDDKAQLNQIETERLLAELVRVELDRRRKLAQLTAEW